MSTTITDVQTLITEVQALSARVDAWLDQADQTVGGYATLQADLQALQAQVQQLAGSDGQVAAHTHQIDEVAGLAAALATKLDDAAGVVQQHHLADGAVTSPKIPPGAITAQHISTTAPPRWPPAFVSGWFAPSAVSSGSLSVQHGLTPPPYLAMVELRAVVDVWGYPAGTSFVMGNESRRYMERKLAIDATSITLEVLNSNDGAVRLALLYGRPNGGGYIEPTATEWEFRLLAW